LSYWAANVDGYFFDGTVIVFTFWNVDGVITVKGEVIEDCAFGASTDGWVFAFLADVEESAVIGLHVSGVVKCLTVGVDLCGVGAGKSVGKNLYARSTSCSESFMFPLAGASEFVKDKASRTASLYSNASSALVVLMAYCWVFVLKVAILSGALHTVGLGGLENGVVIALDDERIVALFNTRSKRRIED